MKLRMIVLSLALVFSGIMHGVEHPVYQQELAVLIKKTEMQRVSDVKLNGISKKNQLTNK